MTRGFPRRADHGSEGARRVDYPEVAGLVLQDSSGRVLVASEQAAQVLEVDRPEALVGRLGVFEAGTVVRLDGSELTVEEQPAAIALRTGQPQDDCVLGFRRPGEETRWFRMRAQPLFKVGSVIPYAAVTRFVRLRGGPDAEVEAPSVGLRAAVASYGCRGNRIGSRTRLSRATASR